MIMQKNATEQKILLTLRIACAMCFLGHGAFGIITKAVWCNYFGVFGIGQPTAYSLMPVVGIVDISFGLLMLLYPLRGAFAWLVIWGLFTALLRPLSGEPLPEAFERAGNYGAPFLLLLLVTMGGRKGRPVLGLVKSDLSLNEGGYRKLILGLRIAAFLLFAGHAWLNLMGKKALLAQYASLGFSDAHLVSGVIGTAELLAAVALLLRPKPQVVFLLFLWKMASELFYPHYEIFEWIERGGSYGVLLALWFAVRRRTAANEERRFDFPFFSKTYSSSNQHSVMLARNILLLVLLSAVSQYSTAQGCVAIRSNGATCTMTGAHDNKAAEPSWTLGLNSRYFKSYKHFVGTVEQKERTEAGTEVINHSFSTELSIGHRINDRWSVALFAPLASNTRSSLYEHYGNASKSPHARRDTRSFGLGDLRIAAYYWLIDPAKNTKFNIQAGAGIKLPTGDYRYQDYFWKNDTTKVLGPVDQSIQLGDGGTGLSTEINAFYKLGNGLSLYTNGYYLINPREQNAVSTARGGTATAAAVQNGSDVMSVPDQFMARFGASLSARRFLFSAGARIEGVPAKDLVGGSNGFRRPGYVVSVEPVASYKTGNTVLYVSVPYAVERNRIQSVPDKIRTEKTGVYTQGDAAFADYTVNFGVLFSLK